MSKQKLSREALAHLEIGSTQVSRPVILVLCAFFLLSIFLTPLVQTAVRSQGPVFKDFLAIAAKPLEQEASLFKRIDERNNSVLEGIDLLETGFEEESFLRKVFLAPLQNVLLSFLRQGNEKVIVGEDDWLFFRPGVDAIVGQPFLDRKQLQIRVDGHELWEKPVQPDPVQAIVDFKNQLKELEIELLVVPVPVKPAIHPEKLSLGAAGKPVYNRSWPEFLQRLEENDVNLFDSRTILAAYAREKGAAYLTTDTHWLPGAMDSVSEALADEIQNLMPHLTVTHEYQLRKVEHDGEGDIFRMLTLPQKNGRHSQSVEIAQVLNSDNELWQPERDSEILLLGDSFTNIYSAPSLGWGRSAGFAEHLSYHLGTAVDLIGKNDSGAFVTREALSQDLSRGRDRLAGKKLVVWQFAERELSLGDWKLIDLTLGSAEESGFFAAEARESVLVQAVVHTVSRSPQPGSVPYRDNVLTIHLVDLKGENGNLEADQALVYGLGMKDNILTEMADLRPGDSVEMMLSSWEEAEAEYGSFRRSPLDDEMLELELPSWGVIDDTKN